MGSQQQQQLAKAASASASALASSSHPLSLDDISIHFSVPLSDAANNLGVCVSVLKKICRENGLDRWPYRKFLAGKSIEDIKKHAIRERNKGHAELAKSGGQSGLQHQNNENTKLQGAMSPHKLQQGSKDVLPGRQQVILAPGSTKGLMGLDEFKYGFPSDGLSVATNKWWGSNQADNSKAVDIVGIDTDEDDEHRCDEKANETGGLSVMDGEGHENGKVVVDIGTNGDCLLTTLRKKTVEEGREAMRLGVYRACGVKKLGKKERGLLLLILGSSLPK